MTHRPVSASRSRPASIADVVDSLRLLQLVAFVQSDLYARAVAAAEFLPAAELTVFSTLSAHEGQHVAAITGLLTTRGSPPKARPAFDFTAGGALPGFDFVAGNYVTFRILAQALEDLGVRAYKGQLEALASDKEALNVVLAIHAVEGRHAAEVRRLRGELGWISGSGAEDVPAFLLPIYAGEELATQGPVNLGSALAANGGATAAAQAFDEPLTTAQVTAILALFVA